jgi:hypothetical protein
METVATAVSQNALLETRERDLKSPQKHPPKKKKKKKKKKKNLKERQKRCRKAQANPYSSLLEPVKALEPPRRGALSRLASKNHDLKSHLEGCGGHKEDCTWYKLSLGLVEKSSCREEEVIESKSR